MEFIIKMIYWIMLFAWGFFVLKYRMKVKDFSGNFVWAETYIWRWGTYLVIIAIWCLMMFLGILLPFWFLDWYLFK